MLDICLFTFDYVKNENLFVFFILVYHNLLNINYKINKNYLIFKMHF